MSYVYLAIAVLAGAVLVSTLTQGAGLAFRWVTKKLRDRSN